MPLVSAAVKVRRVVARPLVVLAKRACRKLYVTIRPCIISSATRSRTMCCLSRPRSSLRLGSIPLKFPLGRVNMLFSLSAHISGEFAPLASSDCSTMSLCSLPEIWGEDADQWNPLRFVEGNIEKEFELEGRYEYGMDDESSLLPIFQVICTRIYLTLNCRQCCGYKLRTYR